MYISVFNEVQCAPSVEARSVFRLFHLFAFALGLAPSPHCSPAQVGERGWISVELAKRQKVLH